MARLPLPPTVPDEAWLHFTPVPVKPRHNGWTAERQHAFILMLAQLGHVRIAAQSVGMTRQSAYDLRKRKGAESFAAAWDRALEAGEDHAIELGMERAIHGEERDVYHRGRKIGTVRRYDNALLRAALRGLDRRYGSAGPDALAKENYEFPRKRGIL